MSVLSATHSHRHALVRTKKTRPVTAWPRTPRGFAVCFHERTGRGDTAGTDFVVLTVTTEGHRGASADSTVGEG